MMNLMQTFDLIEPLKRLAGAKDIKLSRLETFTMNVTSTLPNDGCATPTAVALMSSTQTLR
jgi:hypothetical protein